MTGKKVFVGLSGGVDSAVSAALLQKQGFDVTGVFIRTWHPEGFPCTEGEDEREAMRVAAHLDIPFRTLDLAKRYKEAVAQRMIDGYARGETPNPDALCNREVKFGGFIDFAKQEGADAIATGHYARVEKTKKGIELKQAQDPDKDQSYFLALVPDSELSFSLFPIGSMRKAEVRALAERFNLPNAQRKDSQGICFLGALDLQQFLEQFIPVAPGLVLSPEGKTVGSHRGASLYTIGERHGFTVEAKDMHAEPLYVLSTDIRANTITVGPKHSLQGSAQVVLREVVTHGELSSTSLQAQVRYHGKLHAASVRAEQGRSATVIFEEPALVARGQVVAVYAGDSLVLAGIVDSLG